MWFKAELDPNIQFFLSSMLAWGCLPPPVFANRYAPRFSRAAWAKERRAGNGSDATAGLRYVLLPNAYRVIVPPMTSEM